MTTKTQRGRQKYDKEKQINCRHKEMQDDYKYTERDTRQEYKETHKVENDYKEATKLLQRDINMAAMRHRTTSH